MSLNLSYFNVGVNWFRQSFFGIFTRHDKRNLISLLTQKLRGNRCSHLYLLIFMLWYLQSDRGCHLNFFTFLILICDISSENEPSYFSEASIQSRSHISLLHDHFSNQERSIFSDLNFGNSFEPLPMLSDCLYNLEFRSFAFPIHKKVSCCMPACKQQSYYTSNNPQCKSHSHKIIEQANRVDLQCDQPKNI